MTSLETSRKTSCSKIAAVSVANMVPSTADGERATSAAMVARNFVVDGNSSRASTAIPTLRSAARYMTACPSSSAQLRTSSWATASLSKPRVTSAAAARNRVLAKENW
jgi:hypothetical protein